MSDAIEEFGLPGAVHCAQECSRWFGQEQPIVVPSFISSLRENCKCAILVPRFLSELVRFAVGRQRVPGVVLGPMGIASVYLADSGKSVQVFEDRIQQVGEVLGLFRGIGANF